MRSAGARRGGGIAAALIALTALGAHGVAEAQNDPLADVAAAVRAHDDRRALAMLDELDARARTTPDARYLRGRLLARIGDPRGAARAWDGLADALPPAVRDDVAFERAIALRRGSRCEEAVPELERFTRATSGRRGALARAARAECLLALGRLDEAIVALRTVIAENAGPVDAVAMRLGLADALARKGDRPAAIAELRAVALERPEHPEAAGVIEQITALGGTFEPTVEERIARAARLVDRNHHRDALAELEDVAQPRDRALRAKLLHTRGMALFGTRAEYAEAARVLGRAARLSSETAEEDAFHAARALSRAGRDQPAIAAYRRFVRAHPRHARAALAEYLAAWLELRMGRRVGERSMRRFLDAHPRGDLARDAAWHLAFAAFERRRYRDAAQAFERYAALGDARDAMVHGRGHYWRGRALQLARDRRPAAEAYRAAIAVDPLHWYGLLARERLVELGLDAGRPFGAAERVAAPSSVAPLEPALPEDARFYDRLGLRADAIAAVVANEDAIRRAAPRGRELEAVVVAHRAVGSFARPYRLVAARAADELRRPPDAGNRWAWEAAYPRPYEAHVETAARANDLHPELLWAIMRQESGYDPEAVSYADAIGLLQLLPSTAERIAQGQGVPFHRAMLFDPAWNVRFAARYVAGLVRGLDARLPLAIAGYNAGGHRVAEWRKSYDDGVELDRFVERIPFEQTHNYVRRVTSHYAAYAYLADPEAGWPLELDVATALSAD